MGGVRPSSHLASSLSMVVEVRPPAVFEPPDEHALTGRAATAAIARIRRIPAPLVGPGKGRGQDRSGHPHHGKRIPPPSAWGACPLSPQVASAVAFLPRQ